MSVTDRPSGDLRMLARNAGSSPSPSGIVPARKFAWKTRLLLPGVLVVALLSLIAYTGQDVLWPPRAVHVVPVVVRATASTQVASGSTVQAPGWIEADPFPIAVSALAEGIVKEMLALEGQPLKSGEVVARLVDDDARLALSKAEADLAEKQARQEAAQRNWDNPIERIRMVATTEAMVAESKADLNRLNAEIAAEVARLTSMKLEAERTAESYKNRASSELQSVRAQQEYEAQKSVLDATRARQPVLEAQLAQRAAELHAAKENLRLRIEDARSVAEARAQVALTTAARDEAALRLSRMEIRAPADGVVMQRLAGTGTKLSMNMDDPHSMHVAMLYDPKHLQVRVDVPLADAAKIGVGQAAEIVATIAPDRTFKGRVTRIVNEADIQKNTLQAKVAIDDPSPDLKPEVLARVRFTTDGSTTRPAGATDRQTVFAPLNLVHRMGDTPMAWTFNAGRGVATMRTLQLGTTQHDGWVAVISGLSPGDKLISDSAGLRDGQRVRVAGEPNETAAATGGLHAPH